MNDTACETHLLADTPAATDAFGTHQQVARVLSDTITREDYGLSVALIGSYGVGKSTIVQLLAEDLISNRARSELDARVFVFDAWAHQGDPLRRSFLEEFRAFLVGTAWLRESDFKKAFSSLSRRRQKSKSTSSPVLTIGGMLVAASFFLVPIGLQLLSKGWLGYALSLAPLIATFLVWFFSESDMPVAELLWQKTRDVTSSKSFSYPDPTSVEFRNLFSEIVERALAPTSRRLVIVMDNLDRLDAKDALQMVATMRTFFEGTQRDESRNRKLWLLVPFSRNWTKRLWGDDKSGQDVDPLSDAFLDKNFQVRIHISEPPPTSWKAFLKRLLHDALPEHDGDFGKIYIRYNQLRMARRDHLTPRSIKQFVNRLALSHREWGETVPLSTQAVYVLVSDEEIEIWIERNGRGELVKDVRQQEIVASDPAWKNNIAALYFHVQPAEAGQLLMGDEIRAALGDGLTSQLKDFKDRPHFSDVCETVIIEDRSLWVKDSPQSIVRAASSLRALDVMQHTIWDSIRESFQEVTEWRLAGKAAGEGVVAVFQAFPTDQRRDRLKLFLEALQDPPALDGESGADQALRGWLEAVLPILTWAKTDYQDLLDATFSVGISGENYLSLLDAAQSIIEPGSDAQLLLRARPQPQEVVDALVDRLRSDDAAPGVVTTLKALHKMRERWPFKAIVDALSVDFLGVSLSAPRASAELSVLAYLAFDAGMEDARNTMKTLGSGGQIYHQIFPVMANAEALALALFAFTSFGKPNQDTGNSPGVVNRIRSVLENPDSPENGDIIDRFSGLVNRYRGLRSYLELAKEDPTQNKIVYALVDERFESHGLSLSALELPFVQNYGYIKSLLPPPQFQKLLEAISDDPELDIQVREAGFSLQKVDLYIALLALKKGDREPILDFLRESTRGIDREAWEEQLRTPGPALELLLSLGRLSQGGWLQVPFHDALRAQARAVMEQSTFPEAYANDWTFIVNALQPDLYLNLLRHICDDLIERDVISANIIRLYGDILASTNVLEESAERVVRRLFSNLIGVKEEWSIKWITRIVIEHPKILRDPRASSATEDFIQRVVTLQADADLSEGVQLTVKDLVAALDSIGVKTPPQMPEALEP